MLEQKIKEETIEINTVFFCIDSRKTFGIKSTQKIFFKMRHIRTKYVYSLFQFFDFGLFVKPMTKQAVYQNNFKGNVDLVCDFSGSLPFETHHCSRGLMTSPIRYDLAFNLAQ